MTLLFVVAMLVVMMLAINAAGWWCGQGGFLGCWMAWNMLELAGQCVAAILNALTD